MSYETVASVSQVLSLLLFITMFVGVLFYALWPTNGAKFDEVQAASLDLEARNSTNRNPT